LQYLGIQEIFLAIKDKLHFLEKYKNEHHLRWSEMLYMGDDLPDVPLLQKVGLPACPGDAVMEVKSISQYISAFDGGSGCVRDVIEKVLRLNGHWQYETEVVSK
jgi:3-deoxy-D-manno-octulosonate 8-phosphate phosphatase (KDO 8-P phosphatase)